MKSLKDDIKIAVDMWEQIKWDWVKQKDPEPLSYYKRKFLERLDYKDEWLNDCLLCEYYSYYADDTLRPHLPCTQCSLRNCNEIGSPYNIVSRYETYSIEERMSACDEIIAAIKELDDDN